MDKKRGLPILQHYFIFVISLTRYQFCLTFDSWVSFILPFGKCNFMRIEGQSSQKLSFWRKADSSGSVMGRLGTIFEWSLILGRSVSVFVWELVCIIAKCSSLLNWYPFLGVWCCCIRWGLSFPFAFATSYGCSFLVICKDTGYLIRRNTLASDDSLPRPQ